MYCAAYCTAKSYNLISALKALRGQFKVTSYDDALHFSHDGSQIFIFSYGCLVYWRQDEVPKNELLTLIAPFESHPLTQQEHDQYHFQYGKENKVFLSEITLREKKDTLAKLAISYGLAQSVKLSVFERRIEQTITISNRLSQSLANEGKIPLSRKEIGKRIGALFIERSLINLHMDFLETPDFCWRYPVLEPLYRTTANDFDIVQRTIALNKKLDMIHDLFEILGDALNHSHSAKLEWIIIILIVFEVILSLWSMFGTPLILSQSLM